MKRKERREAGVRAEGSGSQGVGKRESRGREAGIGDPPVHPSKLLALSFILFHYYTLIILLALHICSLIDKRR